VKLYTLSYKLKDNGYNKMRLVEEPFFKSNVLPPSKNKK